MTAPVITTDETTEAIGAVAKALAELRATKTDPANWKWTIIPLHNAMQNFMVLALRFTNPVLVAQVPPKLRVFEMEILAACNNRLRVRDLPAKANPTDDDLAGDAYFAYAESLAVWHLSRPARRAFFQDTVQRQELRRNLLDRYISLLDFQLVGFTELFQRLRQEKYARYTPCPGYRRHPPPHPGTRYPGLLRNQAGWRR